MTIIEQVMQVDYWGTKLTSKNRPDEEVKHQLMKARRSSGCMNNLYEIIDTSHKKQKLGFTKAQYVQ